jgi:hypothetical protein
MKEIRCTDEGCVMNPPEKSVLRMDDDTFVGGGRGLLNTSKDKPVSLKSQRGHPKKKCKSKSPKKKYVVLRSSQTTTYLIRRSEEERRRPVSIQLPRSQHQNLNTKAHPQKINLILKVETQKGNRRNNHGAFST